MKKRDEFVFKIHGDPSRWHVTVCYALLRSVKVYCDSHVLPRSPKIWCPIVTSVAKFLTVKNFATLVTINTIHSRPLAITTIPVYVLSRLPRFFPIVVIMAIVAQCKPSRIGANWLRKTLLFGDAYMYITYQVMFSKEMACNILNPQPEPKLKLDRVLLMGLTQT